MKNLARRSVVFFAIFSYGIVMAGDILTTASEDQKAAISEIEKASSKDVVVKWDERRGVAKFISGQLTEPSDKSKADLSRDFIRQYKVLFGVENPDNELILDNTSAAPRGRFVNFKQKKDGLEVIGGKITVRIEDGVITTVANYFEPNIPVKTTPTLSLEKATAIARREINSPNQSDTASLVVL
jgi:Zn-dependent metalloprotease